MGVLEYCDVASVLALTGITVTATHCSAARYLIDNYSGQNFQAGAENTVTNEIVDGSGIEWLKLDNAPILTVTKVEEDLGTFDTPDWSEVDWAAKDYKTPSEHGGPNSMLLCDGVWTKGKGNFRITYTYGYAAIPDIVKHIACRIASTIKQDPDAQIQSERIGTYSITYGGQGNATKDQVDSLLKQLPVQNIEIGG